jgi:hypothetical protein
VGDTVGFVSAASTDYLPFMTIDFLAIILAMI